MYRHGLRAALAVVGWLAVAAGLDAEDSKEERLVPLVNGKDLDGWVVEGKKEGWKVKDGVLRSDGATGGDWVRSKKEYGDLILKLDWKVSRAGNSGVFIRVPD